MAFYIPLGFRGQLLRIGTVLIGLMATWIYWRASRRRALEAPIPMPVLLPQG